MRRSAERHGNRGSPIWLFVMRIEVQSRTWYVEGVLGITVLFSFVVQAFVRPDLHVLRQFPFGGCVFRRSSGNKYAFLTLACLLGSSTLPTGS